MYLLTEADVNSLLNISGQTDLVNQIIELSESFIHSYTWIDTFEHRTDIETDVKYNNNCKYILNYPNIKKVNKINWENYLGTEWVNYKIVNKRQLLFAHWITPDNFGYVKFEIEAWYEDTSKEFMNLKNACLLIAESYYNYISSSQNWTDNKTITSITIWDISKNFGTWSSWWASASWNIENWVLTNITKAKIILNKFKLLNVYS